MSITNKLLSISDFPLYPYCFLFIIVRSISRDFFSKTWDFFSEMSEIFLEMWDFFSEMSDVFSKTWDFFSEMWDFFWETWDVFLELYGIVRKRSLKFV